MKSIWTDPTGIMNLELLNYSSFGSYQNSGHLSVQSKAKYENLFAQGTSLDVQKFFVGDSDEAGSF